jgi:hypothetical protein
MENSLEDANLLLQTSLLKLATSSLFQAHFSSIRLDARTNLSYQRARAIGKAYGILALLSLEELLAKLFLQ